ncbi:MAG: hypothetical protein WC152_03510 [Candidatus Izemoplasmatales bacterium]
MRKSNFQILQEHFDLRKERKRIEKLFKDILFYKDDSTEWSPEELVDQYLFYNWKQRNRCIDLADMKEVLCIDDLFEDDEPSIDNLVKYLEYVVNILYLAESYMKNNDKINYYKNYIVLRENLNTLLDNINHEIHLCKNDEKALIVPKNEAVTAVADIVKPEIALKVIKYNHYLLKGDIETKKSILLDLGENLEPKRKELKELDKTLESNIFYLLNNMNIRHNNKDKSGKNYKEFVYEMELNQLEEWYDEIYQLQLLAFLLIKNVERNKKIEDLKIKMGK